MLVKLPIYPSALMLTLSLLIPACGGGGGGGGTGGGTVTPPPPAPAACFSDYDDSNPQWDAFRSNRGQVVYTEDNRRALYLLNLATSQSRLISDQVDDSETGSIAPSTLGTYMGYYSSVASGLGTPGSMSYQDLATASEVRLSPVAGETFWSPMDGAVVYRAPGMSALALNAPLGMSAFLTIDYPLFTTWAADDSRVMVSEGSRLDVYTISDLQLEYSLTLADEPVGTDAFEYSYSSFSPEGRFLLYVTIRSEQAHWNLLELATGARREVFTTTANVSGAEPPSSWSPSGNFLAIASYDASFSPGLNIYSVSADSVQSVVGGEQDVFEHWWAPGADKLLFTDAEGGNAEDAVLKLVAQPADATSEIVSGPGRFEAVLWSPDSRYFAYTLWDANNEGRVFTADADASCYEELAFLNGNGFTSVVTYLGWSPSGQYVLYAPGDMQDQLEYTIARPDGSGVTSLNPVIAQTASEVISDYQWTVASDTVFFKRLDAGTLDAKGIDFIEVDSLQLLEVEQLGATRLAQDVWLLPEL